MNTTKFVFINPACFIEANKYLDGVENILDDPKAIKAFCLLMHKDDAEREARWRWLAENKSQVSFMSLETEDLGYAWGNVFKVYDDFGLIYEEVFDLGGPRTVRRLKNKMRRFGLPTDALSVRILH